MGAITLSAAVETWPLADPFVISRGAKGEATVVVATVSDGRCVGRGECVPYARYRQTPEGAVQAIRRAAGCLDRARLQREMPASAARNAIDCALWDLEAKQMGKTAAELAGAVPLSPLLTCFTLSLASPDTMAAKAAAVPQHPLLKLKLGAPGDEERMRAVRKCRPDARLVADANEGWSPDRLGPLLSVAAECGVELVEQPLPEHGDAVLATVPHPVPVCADESAHTSQGIGALRGRYDAVNIKLDKTGGLTEALAMAREACRLGLKIMVGSMVATSLSMAPAFIVAQEADWVDLDGPLLLARDRVPGLEVVDGWLQPPPASLWG
jgi:L-alanine-DL-glutamate epimerase-like enolase superfamily enzyme